MYMLNGWWLLSSSGSYPPVFTVVYYCVPVLFILPRTNPKLCFDEIFATTIFCLLLPDNVPLNSNLRVVGMWGLFLLVFIMTPRLM